MKDTVHEIVLMEELPPSLKRLPQHRRGSAKWSWLHKRVNSLTPDLPVLRVTLPDKKETKQARDSLRASQKGKPQPVTPPEGYRIITRAEPIASPDGDWFFYIALEKLSEVEKTAPPLTA